MSRSAIVVFGKIPLPGEVKTRLSPELNAQQAASLYAAFLSDALHQYAASSYEVRLYLVPSSSRLDDLPDDVSAHLQTGDGLGDRMLAAIGETSHAGFERIVVIGTDHPTLPTHYVRRAFETLDGPDRVVIGPAEDGGYYLIGMQQPHSEIFRDREFGHDGVFAEAVERIRNEGLILTTLPSWYDVDTASELHRLVRELEERPEAAPRTAALLARMAGDNAFIRSIMSQAFAATVSERLSAS